MDGDNDSKYVFNWTRHRSESCSSHLISFHILFCVRFVYFIQCSHSLLLVLSIFFGHKMCIVYQWDVGLWRIGILKSQLIENAKIWHFDSTPSVFLKIFSHHVVLPSTRQTRQTHTHTHFQPSIMCIHKPMTHQQSIKYLFLFFISFVCCY